MTTLFISHSSSDDRRVRAVVGALEHKGVKVWVDHHDLSAGGDIAGRINDGLEQSDAFLLLFSQDAAESKWVKQEWSAALSRHLESEEKFPLLIGLLDSARPPRVLQGMKTVDLSGDLTRGLNQLCEGIVTDNRPIVWYFDDMPSALDKFEKDHGSAFRFRGFSDPAELMPALMTGQMAGETPDILLIDFYSVKRGLPADQVEAANQSIATMIEQEKELKKHVDAAWRPGGVEVVETVREFYPASVLPIAMHTQQGLILLRDDLMRQLEYLNVGWLIKNRFSPATDRMVLAGIARQSGHTITRARPRALIIDDNVGYIESFIGRQKEHYEIESLTEVDSVMGKLAELEAGDRMPDIFLVDMYYPTGDESQELIDLANRKLKEFAALEAEMEQIVQRSFEPLGISMIRQIRHIFPPYVLPILVYSVSGLVTVGDQAFREVENRGCGWLLKNRYDVSTEEVMIMGEIMRARADAAAGPASARR